MYTTQYTALHVCIFDFMQSEDAETKVRDKETEGQRERDIQEEHMLVALMTFSSWQFGRNSTQVSQFLCDASDWAM